MNGNLTDDNLIEGILKNLFNSEKQENIEKPGNLFDRFNYYGTKNRSKLRDLIPIILNAPLIIDGIQHKNKKQIDGWATFSITLENLGLTPALIQAHKKEIYSNHFASFISEIIIHENIGQFMSVLSELNIEEYSDSFSGPTHGSFGLSYSNGKMFFSFHISYLNNLLTSDFKLK